MPRSYQKNILRTFRSTKSRFIAIFSIVALGVGFLAGLMSTTPDMKDSMERYLDAARLYDIRLVSTLGLTDDDVAAVQKLEGVAAVQPSYSLDLLLQVGEDTLVARAQSLPPQTDDALNRLTLIEGRWPEAPGECVVDAGVTRIGGAAQLGQTYTVSPDNEDLGDSLPGTQFTAVGVVRSAAYFSIEREAASVGDGSVALLFYLPASEFSYDAYTELYIALRDTPGLASLEADYDAAVDAAVERLEGIEDARCQARFDGLVADARAELDDGWAEYNDARAEADEAFAEAEQELADARKELADGEKKYHDGVKELADAEQELADARRQIADGRAALPGAESRLAEAQAKYDAGLADYNAGAAQLAEGKAQLDALEAQYTAFQALPDYIRIVKTMGSPGQNFTAVEAQFSDDALQQMAADIAARQSLAAVKKELDDAQAALDAAAGTDTAELQTKLEAAQAAWAAAAQAAYPGTSAADAQTQAEAAIAGLADLQSTLTQYTELNAQSKVLDAAAVLAAENYPIAGLSPETVREFLINDPTQYIENRLLPQMRSALNDSLELYSENAAALAAGKAQLDAGKAQLDAGRAQYEAGKARLADAERQLADGEREVKKGRQELADAWQEILDGRQELADGEKEYADERADAEAELADALQELEDGEAELADLELPEWYIQDRAANTSFNSFKGNVSKVEAIARVFPIFFFLVAALVVSTTMTRMVEEERLQIGTMKAMGYARGAIMQKYIWYALTAAVLGALAGLALGFTVFPSVIWYAYEMMYYMPHLSTPWRANYALMAGGLLIGCALVATLSACRATLRETPADLMRPRAPKAGKRIILERIGFFWRRLPFTYKVTCRNLLRYKKRFWMTVIGVAGCTALLVTGFGISDSLNGIAIKQYGQIYRYDLLTAVTDEADTQTGPVHDYLFSDPAFAGSLAAATELVKQEMPDGSMAEVYLLTPQNAAAFADFADLHERVSRKPTPLTDDGVILTEKLAETLGVKAGDTVTLENTDGARAAFTVTGVCEHYVMNYAYFGPAAYEKGFGTLPAYNTVLSLLSQDTPEARAAVAATLLGMEGVGAVNFTTDQMTTVLNMLNSINAVVVLIIVCAASLAFVVLYNLTNINIAERVKEIATIKVLGFYDREVSAYVNRESIILSVIGALLGLLGGIALHKFVIYTVEVDAVMFGREIEPVSFVYAFALTMLFSIAVDLVMGRKLKRISMVESMKAPE